MSNIAIDKNMDSDHSANPASDRIFELLRRRGPLCLSQLGVELALPPRDVRGALLRLEGEGMVERRPDACSGEDSEDMPWGLRTPKFTFFGSQARANRGK